MKVLFMGTPEFASVCLSALINSAHEVVGVVTQPDRALKRGKTEQSPVKSAAVKAGIEVIQPEKIREHADELKRFGADIAVTAAYGQLLTQSVLDAFPRGVINVHASLLPKYRGASPIQAAIANGETETGVTIMQTELGLDSGDILASVKVPIASSDDAGSLTDKLAAAGSRLLVQTLDGFDGITPVKQDGAAATHCRTIKKNELFIDFGKSARDVVNQIRSLSPAPGAKTEIGGEIYKIYEAVDFGQAFTNAEPGEIVECGKRLVIACGEGSIEIKSIQAPSKRRLSIAEFLRGKRFDIGVKCGILQ